MDFAHGRLDRVEKLAMVDGNSKQTMTHARRSVHFRRMLGGSKSKPIANNNISLVENRSKIESFSAQCIACGPMRCAWLKQCAISAPSSLLRLLSSELCRKIRSVSYFARVIDSRSHLYQSELLSIWAKVSIFTNVCIRIYRFRVSFDGQMFISLSAAA